MLLLCLTIMVFSGCENQNTVSETETFIEPETITEGTDEAIEMKTLLENESTLEISADTDILLSVKTANSDNLELEICNKSSNTIFFSSWFIIEKKQNDIWYQQYIKAPEEIVWVDSLGYLDADNTTIINENWSGKYPNISEGKYRIIKAFFWDERNQDEKVYVACEFNIE